MRTKLALILTGVILGASSVAIFTEYKKYKRFKETLEAEADFKSGAEVKKHKDTCPFTKTACEFDDCTGCKNDIRPIYRHTDFDDVADMISDLDTESTSFAEDLRRAHASLDAILADKAPIYKGSDTSAEEDFADVDEDEPVYEGSDTSAKEDFADADTDCNFCLDDEEDDEICFEDYIDDEDLPTGIKSDAMTDKDIAEKKLLPDADADIFVEEVDESDIMLTPSKEDNKL